ncbi:Neuroserpin [Orchesella cincta]|uniref:Neuroserpin n=1 Tax=Orchesella cincta TaxID=48709 RepID=A0A1D2N3F4_ORCCI|nr:Neuroserpin [Orchesella cincta]
MDEERPFLFSAATSWLSVIAIGLISTLAFAQDNAELKAVTTGNMAFGSDLYDVLRKSSKDNLIVSPISVATVMAMLQAGARGKTAEAIRKTMKFPEDDQLNKGYQALLQLMKSDDSFTLEMANRIYPAEGFKLNGDFANTLKTYFAADPQQLNYKQPETAARTINDFVSASTHDRIKDLIGPSDLDDLTRLVLVNAIYFKGTWKNQFPKDDTTKMDFYVSENDTIKVDMMRLETEMSYGENRELDAKIVALPYKGDRLSMVILLPNKRTGLAEMEDKLKNIPLEQILDGLRERKVQLFLPKFKLESTIDLKEPLTALGAGDIFSDNADLSGISQDGKEQLYVSKAVQKAFIEVNEEGSEAAGKIIRKRSLDESPRVIVDHSCIYGIVSTKSLVDNASRDIDNALLFYGRLLQPQPIVSKDNIRDEL